MKKPFFVLFVSLFSCPPSRLHKTRPRGKPKAGEDHHRRREQGNTFARAENGRSNAAPFSVLQRDQIKQVQAMLKRKTLYKGEATGTYNDETREGIKSFQKDNGLKETGTLNRATLEKMNITLTDSQKAIPVSDSSYAPAETKSSGKDRQTDRVRGETCKGSDISCDI